MAQRTRVWVRILAIEQKMAIATICDGFIATTLKPCFLPEITALLQPQR